MMIMMMIAPATYLAAVACSGLELFIAPFISWNYLETVHATGSKHLHYYRKSWATGLRLFGGFFTIAR